VTGRTRVRLFAALELPGEAVRALLEFRDAAADAALWRPVAAESLHVTLAFMGSRDADDVDPAGGVLRTTMGEAAGGAGPGHQSAGGAGPGHQSAGGAGPGHQSAGGAGPRLALAGALLLPPRRARVLCAALDDPDGTLAALRARVAGGLAQAGLYGPEARPFRPHVTVARLRSGARAPREIVTAPEPVRFAGTALTFFESRLHPSGARYAALIRVPFAPLS